MFSIAFGGGIELREVKVCDTQWDSSKLWVPLAQRVLQFEGVAPACNIAGTSSSLSSFCPSVTQPWRCNVGWSQLPIYACRRTGEFHDFNGVDELTSSLEGPYMEPS